MRVFSFLAACTFLFLAGCDFGNPICPAVAEPAVIVEVRNAVTDDPEAENADGVLIDGGTPIHSESMKKPTKAF